MFSLSKLISFSNLTYWIEEIKEVWKLSLQSCEYLIVISRGVI